MFFPEKVLSFGKTFADFAEWFNGSALYSFAGFFCLLFLGALFCASPIVLHDILQVSNKIT